MFFKYKNVHRKIQQNSKTIHQVKEPFLLYVISLSTIKATVTNHSNIKWNFLHKFFNKNHFVSKTMLLIFFMQILLSFSLLNLSSSTRKLTLLEGICILPQCLGFLYNEKPTFELNSSNCCLIFSFITS